MRTKLRTKEDFGSERLHHVDLFNRNRSRHGELSRIALRRRNQGQPDAGVAPSPLNHLLGERASWFGKSCTGREGVTTHRHRTRTAPSTIHTSVSTNTSTGSDTDTNPIRSAWRRGIGNKRSSWKWQAVAIAAGIRYG
jgi:hypothetical protein